MYYVTGHTVERSSTLEWQILLLGCNAAYRRQLVMASEIHKS